MCLCTRDRVNQTDFYCTVCSINFHISCLKKQSSRLPSRKTFVCGKCKDNTNENQKPQANQPEDTKSTECASHNAVKWESEVEFSEPIKPNLVSNYSERAALENPAKNEIKSDINALELDQNPNSSPTTLDRKPSPVRRDPVSDKVKSDSVIGVNEVKSPEIITILEELPESSQNIISEKTISEENKIENVIELTQIQKDRVILIDLDSEEEQNVEYRTIEKGPNPINSSSESKKRKESPMDQESFLLKMDQDITKLGQTPIKPTLAKKIKVLESISTPVVVVTDTKRESNTWFDEKDQCQVIDLTEKQLADLKIQQLSQSKFQAIEPEENPIAVVSEREGDSEDEWMMRITNYAENAQLIRNLDSEVTKTIMENIPTDAAMEKALKVIKADLINQNGGNGTPRGLSVTLMEHQIHGLAWMMHMERNEKTRGGILADDMGLGKTIQTLALLHQNRIYPSSDRAATLIVAPLALIHQWKREIFDKSRTKLNVKVHHGADRIKDKKDLRKFDVVITTYSVLQLDAPEPSQTLPDGTILPEKRPGVLYKAYFQRVVLDEAHIIKNRKSRISSAASMLDAEYRFSLTGTPLQNCVDDIYSQLRFLQVPVWLDYQEFARCISKNITKDNMQKSKHAIQQLQAILKAYLLRRTKDAKDAHGQPIIRLVDRLVEIEKIHLGPAERQFYDIISNKASVEFDHIMGAAKGMFNYSSILVLLLRMRQAASHPHLIKEVFEEAHVGNYNLTFMHYSSGILNQMEARNGLLDFVAGPEKPELAAAKRKLSRATFESVMTSAQSGELIYQSCPLCSDVVTNGKISYCGHAFCGECIEGYLQTNAFSEEEVCAKLCPVCREAIRPNELIAIEVFLPSQLSRNPSDSPISDSEKTLKAVLEQLHPDGNFHDWITSSKVDKMIEILHSIREESRDARAIGGDPIKTVVFTQWTSFMDIAQYDGTMSSEEREKAVHDFMNDKNITVAFVSLKCGGVGLNLTAASRVILLDLWWNPSVEDQAIDRVHRIGQTNVVKVYRLAVDDSVEDRILVLQEQKRALADGALGEGEFKLPRLTREDLRFLFRNRAQLQPTIDFPTFQP
ncbi:hypothetical protein HDV06_005286 [Boothiomyces sp. JEL0866]|nr:hypothetical protein HDV06_005286 [Boothiomyces sp. JEL0866]